jgi:hypothetical protein
MNNFDHLQIIMRELDTLEEGLRTLRDFAETKTKAAINGALGEAQRLRDRLWQVDKALENETSAGA